MGGAFAGTESGWAVEGNYPAWFQWVKPFDGHLLGAVARPALSSDRPDLLADRPDLLSDRPELATSTSSVDPDHAR